MSRQKAYGQNFLHHKPTIDKIINEVNERISNQSCILIEIGPGEGALTKDLIQISINKKIPFHIIEKDIRLKDGIEEIISSYQKLPISFSMLDATDDLFIQKCKELYQKYKLPIFIASNLPYSVSTTILSNICWLRMENVPVLGCVVMVQKEVADRMKAKACDSDNRGSFSLHIQTYFECNKLFDVAPGAFTPAPKVMSTVLELKPLNKIPFQNPESAQKFESFCKFLFSSRRKMIRKTLSTLCDADKLHTIFKNLHLDGTERAETLELSTVIELFIQLKQ